MASYPGRYYGDRKIPPQKKSMHHYCVLGNIGSIKESLGDEVWSYLLNSPVGCICKLVESDFIWSAKTVHNVITRQLATEKNHEIWCLVDDQPIRFSLCKFAAISGMNSQPYEETGTWDTDHKELWGDMKISLTDGPSWDDLKEVLRRCRTWSFDKRRMVGCLCVIAVGVLGLHSSTKIPLKFAKTVLDVEAFEQFPWGRVACESLIEFVKLADLNSKSYTIGGFVPILQIWVYEAITILGERFGNKIDGMEVPLLSWAGSRKRFNFDDLVLEEKNNQVKVRVRHIIVNNGEDPKPRWSDDTEDVGVDKLLEDILHDRLPRNVWSLEAESKSKGKEPVDESDDDFVEACISRTAKNLPRNNKRKGETSVKESETVRKGEIEQKMSSMEVNVSAKMASIEGKVGSKMASMEGMVQGKLCQFENELKAVKELEKNASKEEAMHSSGSLKDDGNSKDPSWMVMQKQTSDGMTMQCVARSTPAFVKEAVFPPYKPTDDLIDITDEVAKADDATMAKPTDSGSTFSNPVEHANCNKVDMALNALAGALGVKTPAPKRNKQKAPSQLSPFLGKSAVSRLKDGVIRSLRAYDPFHEIEPFKMAQLIERINEEKENPIGSFVGSCNFYKTLMTPKERWPKNDLKFGWLGECHISSFAHLLRKRFLCDPTPFYSTRIAFLDQCWVSSWYHDYKQFAINTMNFMFRESYIEVMNGVYPYYAITNKKWVADVDHLYFAHNIKGRHWIGLHVNLVRQHIDVYDCIISAYSDKEIIEEVKPYARMLPYMLRSIAPPASKKDIVLKQYTIYRRRSNVPQNIQSGDCGVYTCKFLECLALGYSFEGIND
ncbi:hypothetical protein EUTSA_v10005571mg [Eutrema salsugineum]|uniref:Ubiquitin-like protease family profile domain-containing protein n=1 Tax=Eutrema salsugineum TaxID=72664 RepID=V4KT95_EUTSA|nr:hypothetical protein EUTSA_v10005571mg [Eutrema salsugineum]